MGYSTDFEGSFTLDKPLSIAQYNYLKAFNEIRHVSRHENITEKLPDRLRTKVGLPVGVEGEFYVGDADEGVIDQNQEAKTQPGLWCQWTPTEDGEGIEWDGGEKFYNYVEWLEYIITSFIKPWGFKLNGEVKWEGESNKDMGKIVVKDNKVTTKVAKVTYKVAYGEGDDEEFEPEDE
jgi:hypothetical protein